MAQHILDIEDEPSIAETTTYAPTATCVVGHHASKPNRKQDLIFTIYDHF